MSAKNKAFLIKKGRSWLSLDRKTLTGITLILDKTIAVSDIWMLTFLAEEWRHQGMPELSSFLLTLYNLGCFHTSTFGAHPGSIDVRIGFVWMIWTLSSDLGCAPANCARVRLKRVVWGTVHVNSGTVRCWCECNRTKSRKWTAINVVLFYKNVYLCVCFIHFPDECDWRAASRKLYVSFLPSAFFRAFVVHS